MSGGDLYSKGTEKSSQVYPDGYFGYETGSCGIFYID